LRRVEGTLSSEKFLVILQILARGMCGEETDDP
jgi:hypothetical protein